MQQNRNKSNAEIPRTEFTLSHKTCARIDELRAQFLRHRQSVAALSIGVSYNIYDVRGDLEPAGSLNVRLTLPPTAFNCFVGIKRRNMFKCILRTLSAWSMIEV
jgi:hypothetical protein